MIDPVFEATFALDRKNPLKLYDCLIPVLINREKADKIMVEIENEEL